MSESEEFEGSGSESGSEEQDEGDDSSSSSVLSGEDAEEEDDGEEESDDGGLDDDLPPDEVEPEPRKTKKQNRQDKGSTSKKQKPSANPFEDLEQAEKDAEESEEREKEERRKKVVDEAAKELVNPDALVCLICQGPFTYPVMECVSCHAPMCKKPCLQSWSITKLGPNSNKQVPCPGCKSTAGYVDCHFKNKELGNERVPCKNSESGCKQMVARNSMREHRERFCEFTVVQCKNRPIGCTWEDFRYTQHKHDEECDMAEQAAALEKRKAQLAAANAELEALEKRAAEAVAMIEEAKDQASLVLFKKEMALYATQQCALLGSMSNVMKVRKPDVQKLQARTRTNSVITVLISVHIDDAGFFSLHCSVSDDVTRFPLWLTGFLRINDGQFQGGDGCRNFNLNFNGTREKEEHLIFDERAEWPEGADTKKRNKIIDFSIIMHVLHPDQPRA